MLTHCHFHVLCCYVSCVSVTGEQRPDIEDLILLALGSATAFEFMCLFVSFHTSVVIFASITCCSMLVDLTVTQLYGCYMFLIPLDCYTVVWLLCITHSFSYVEPGFACLMSVDADNCVIPCSVSSSMLHQCLAVKYRTLIISLTWSFSRKAYPK